MEGKQFISSYIFQKIEELQQENDKMKTAIGRLESSVSYILLFPFFLFLFLWTDWVSE